MKFHCCLLPLPQLAISLIIIWTLFDNNLDQVFNLKYHEVGGVGYCKFMVMLIIYFNCKFLDIVTIYIKGLFPTIYHHVKIYHIVIIDLILVITIIHNFSFSFHIFEFKIDFKKYSINVHNFY